MEPSSAEDCALAPPAKETRKAPRAPAEIRAARLRPGATSEECDILKIPFSEGFRAEFLADAGRKSNVEFRRPPSVEARAIARL